MKESYWGYWLMVFGVFIIVVLLLVQSFTGANTQDYYLIKEITESSMVDAVDYGYYRTYGEIKINKEKFYEVFLRRFAEEASLATTYDIEFTEIYEAPPKVGVKVSSKSGAFNVAGDATQFDIVNKIDAILESSLKSGNSNGTYDTSYSDNVGTTITENPNNSSGSNTTNPSDDSSSEGGKKSVNNAKSSVRINQEEKTIPINGTDVHMDCACGPIAMTEAIMMLGKTDALKSYIQSELGYTPKTNEQYAAAVYILMYQNGLNGNPSLSVSSDGSFCGGKGNYKKNGNSFLNNVGLSVDKNYSAGELNSSSSGFFAEKIYESLLKGNVVVASVSKNNVDGINGTGLAHTSSGHYYTIYGYDKSKNCFNVYNPITYYQDKSLHGDHCVSYDAVNKYFTEYVSVSK